MSQKAAYLAAGYRRWKGVCQMMNKPNVRARIEELMDESAARNRITIDAITNRLLAMVERNEGAEAIAAQSLARHALMDLARMHGLVGRTVKSAEPLKLDEPITEVRWVIVAPDGTEKPVPGR